LPFKAVAVIARAPVNPVSSSTVKRASSGPWARASSSKIAMAAATPMPLSAPRVVPVAPTQPSRMTGVIGSFKKSWATSEFFSQTMSRWPWRMIPGEDSLPADAGLATKTFPAASFFAANFRDLAQARM